MRLRETRDFKRVFGSKQKVVTSCFALYYAPNTHQVARLGVVVSKRNVRLAHKRNRIKRLCREHFRVHHAQLVGYDWVLVARSILSKRDKPEMHRQLKKLWHLVLDKIGSAT